MYSLDMPVLWQDFLFGIRMLAKQPGFTARHAVAIQGVAQ